MEIKLAPNSRYYFPVQLIQNKTALFINLEGRLQKCVKATYPPGVSKEDWKIFNLISKN